MNAKLSKKLNELSKEVGTISEVGVSLLSTMVGDGSGYEFKNEDDARTALEAAGKAIQKIMEELNR